ncbi:MAG TPA: ABC transporter permease [Myxococcota bacterium]
MKLVDLQLVRAELIKLRHASLVRGLFAIGIFAVFTIVFVFSFAESRASLRWPANVVTLSGALVAVATFVPVVLGAFIAGSEQAQDTWKTILVRRPTRAPFIVAKFVSGIVVCAVAIAIGFGVALVAFEIVGRIVEAPINPDSLARAAVPGIATAVMMLFVGYTLAFSVALVSTSSAMSVGIIAGLVTLGISAQLAQLEAWFSPFMFAHAKLGACLLGDVSEGCGRDVVVVVAWVIVPLLVSTIVFSRRDQLSGIG